MARRQLWTGVAKASAVIATPIAGLTYWNVTAKKARTEPPVETSFPVGTMDDLLSDRLKTGDIILFSRDWKAMQPGAALLSVISKKVHKCRYDGVGIIVSDRFGVPWVAEQTLAGPKFRRYDERICWSKSKEITVIPVEHKPSNDQRLTLERYAKMSVEKYRSSALSKWAAGGIELEAASLIKALYCQATDTPSEDFMPEFTFSPKANFVGICLVKLKLLDQDRAREMEKSGELEGARLSIKDIFDKRLPLVDGAKYGEPLTVRISD